MQASNRLGPSEIKKYTYTFEFSTERIDPETCDPETSQIRRRPRCLQGSEGFTFPRSCAEELSVPCRGPSGVTRRSVSRCADSTVECRVGPYHWSLPLMVTELLVCGSLPLAK